MRRLLGVMFSVAIMLSANTAFAVDCEVDETCPGGQVCVDGVCVDPCVPDCMDKACDDDDGCGEMCGCEDGLVCIESACVEVCVPDCEEKLCNEDDGCGEMCGCGELLQCCEDGLCAEDCGGTCEPMCEGKVCGADGCGGSCGECADGEYCIANLCMAPPAGSCVDSCGAQSGDGDCFCDEECIGYGDCCSDICDECTGVVSFCVDLSNCGNNECELEIGENCGNCGDCVCDEGDVCAAGECCTPTCADGWECGEDGCGGSCGECGEGFACKENACVEFTGLAECLGLDTPSADNCDMVDSYEGCCDELGRVVWCDGGQTYCIDCSQNPEGECGWQGDFYDCGTDGSPDPSGGAPKECIACDPACEPGFLCEGGVCVECQPMCVDMECGDDGCGGSCGECADGFTCQAGECVDLSQICNGPTEASGDDCGDLTDIGCCDAGGRLYWCEGGQLFCWDCAAEDQAECGWQAEYEWYNCSTEGTADPTGTNPMLCGDDCVPMCDGLNCGDDGCGGSCGQCDPGAACEAGVCAAGPICQDECATGEIGCEGNMPFVCEEGPDGCLIKAISECEDGLFCVDGDCVADAPVVDEGGTEGDVVAQADTTGEEPGDDDGDSGGCTTGATPAQPLVLFLMLLALIGLPVAQRRRS